MKYTKTLFPQCSLLSLFLLLLLSISCARQDVQYGSGLGKVKPSATIGRAERKMHSRLNSDRKKKGLQSLKWDPRLADVARFHSRDMKQNDFFGHTSPNTGSLDNRLVRAGYLAAVARENVGIAPDVQVGQDNFLNSPGHRANILSEDVTHVGIGIVPGSSERPEGLTITQVFAQPVAVESPSTTKNRIERQIREGRRSKGLAPVGTDSILNALAKKHVGDFRGDVSRRALGRVGEAVNKEFQKKRRISSGAIVTVAQSIYAAQDFQISSALMSERVSSFGIAVSGVKDESGRPQKTVLLLVLISAR